MKDRENILRSIPQVEKILQIDEIKRFVPFIGRSVIVEIVREEILRFREKVKEASNLEIQELVNSIIERCRTKKLSRLQRVINGTGVILHTNLGRAPLSDHILRDLMDSLSGYCNLEFHLATGTRGKRGGFAEELICHLTRAEDALIVNNNASCVFLILNQFASGREVIVSRGELIQIGGGFRIPDIMRQTGARLVEVGTTNITELDDVRDAITENTAMILSAHQSNYRIEGFTKRPSLKELAGLAGPDILFVRDLGSGNLVTSEELPQPFEPTVSFELSQGPDLVCFSGDKLLGGCQAGIILGKSEYVQELRKNPLMRMIRVDKITYFLLQETLLSYVNGEIKNVLSWDLIFQTEETIKRRVRKFIRGIDSASLKESVTSVPLKSAFGGGSLPGIEIDSVGVQIDAQDFTAEEIYSAFLAMEVPIIGYILNDRFTIDFRTVADRDIVYLARALEALLKKCT
jgi:L-seryl-tRNA(Ser) seleniumtransferase